MLLRSVTREVTRRNKKGGGVKEDGEEGEGVRKKEGVKEDEEEGEGCVFPSEFQPKPLETKIHFLFIPRK